MSRREEGKPTNDIIPDVHKKSASSVDGINPPITAHFLSPKLVAGLEQANVDAGNASDRTRVDDELDVHKLREVSSIVAAVHKQKWGDAKGDQATSPTVKNVL